MRRRTEDFAAFCAVEPGPLDGTAVAARPRVLAPSGKRPEELA